jgi:hypothetical protein
LLASTLKRRVSASHTGVSSELIERCRRHPFADHVEVGCFLSDFDLGADQGHRVSPHRNGAFAFFRHERILLEMNFENEIEDKSEISGVG